MSHSAIYTFVDTLWDNEIVPTLSDYIRIPNVSQMFDADWEKNGHTDKAVALLADWARKKTAALPGATVSIIREANRGPAIFIEIPGTGKGNVFMYGHLDKQPGVTGWDENKGPWTPVIENGKLYGRGGADDGYALFAELSALLALDADNAPRPRATILIESGEESGSPDLTHYMESLGERIGPPDLIVVLDSGCGTYDQLWLTSSLRGIAAGTLKVEVLTAGLHSGDVSGIVPSSMRIFRQLLSRIEDENTGAIKLPEFSVEIPADRLEQAKDCATIQGDAVFGRMPFAGHTKPMGDSTEELVLNRTWRPQLAVVGIDGYPHLDVAGNVLLPYTAAKLSIRLPPTCDATKALGALKKALEENPPYDAKVTFTPEAGQSGWNAPDLSPEMTGALKSAAEAYFGKPIAYMGEGGSIPFLAYLGKRFPTAQFIVTGVLGPNANAHGPNEFLHIDAAKKITASVADTLAALAGK